MFHLHFKLNLLDSSGYSNKSNKSKLRLQLLDYCLIIPLENK